VNIITVDFETYYDKDISLRKLTTEEYVRHEQFEVIGVSVKVNNEETAWLSGPHDALKKYLHANYDWENSAVLAHNTMFDGAILSWLFDIHPRVWLDTLCMARALHGTEVGGSLAFLAEKYGLGVKGNEIVNAVGKRLTDFNEEELGRYGDYCVNDTELTYKLYKKFEKDFPVVELKIIDLTLRMFIDPVLELNVEKLKRHLDILKDQKDDLLEEAGIEKSELMSNPKFAKALEALGVVPPMKTSLRTGKESFAFAKSDEAFKALQEHDNPKVQALVAARIGLKSTLEETRTQRFIEVASRGKMPVPIRYYAAHTGRWGGSDKINLQNLPSRGPNAKVLKSSICAPEGYSIIEADSAQIEARVLAWLSQQVDLVRAFENGEDVYKKMAGSIYGKKEEDISAAERFIGKTTILGCGYGMGAVRFKEQLQSFGVDMEQEEAARIIKIYRQTNSSITKLWRECQVALEGMRQGDAYAIGLSGVLQVIPKENGIQLPNGLMMRYDNLKAEEGEKGLEYFYKTRRGDVRIYGGKVVENVCQAIARCIMAEQMLMISKKYRVLLTVHDSVVCCVPDKELDKAAAYVDSCMRHTPEWAKGLPVRGDVETGKNYGECTEWLNPHGPSAA
jgi:DNA polymerase I-like protein with 3'-5' exonuclease and polymerase domains